VHQKVIPIIKYPTKSYHAVNVVDEATINLPDFLLVVADSVSFEGTFCGSSSGTWIDGFHIKRPTL
jgi:hypothetical protein